MNTIYYTKSFSKAYKKRISSNKSLVIATKKAISLFISNCNNPKLKDHALKGQLKGYRAFSVKHDTRIIYYVKIKNNCYFVDIGTHSQVYGE